MAQRSHVPKFGNWESEENVPYTVYFDKARKGRGGKMINPNDPEENADAFPGTESPARAPPSRLSVEPEEPIGMNDPPARHENMGRRTANETAHQRPGGRGNSSGEGYRRPTRPSTGSEHSIERSPLHPHYQARLTGRGSGSPSWEGKGSTDGSHGTPGRSRMRGNARGDDDLDRGAAVPKFGEWDESNPASADGFTHIFNKVREEKHTGATTPNRATNSYGYNQKQNNNDDSVKVCCFPWGKK